MNACASDYLMLLTVTSPKLKKSKEPNFTNSTRQMYRLEVLIPGTDESSSGLKLEILMKIEKETGNTFLESSSNDFLQMPRIKLLLICFFRCIDCLLVANSSMY